MQPRAHGVRSSRSSSRHENDVRARVHATQVFVKIRCPLDRLKQQADDINYKLLLDPIKLRIHATKGKKDNAGHWIWLPIDIQDSENQSPYDPYDMIYGQVTSMLGAARHAMTPIPLATCSMHVYHQLCSQTDRPTD